MSVNSPTTGINIDNSEINSPQGSTRFVLNGVVEPGNLGSIVSEGGNTLHLNWPTGFKPIGSKHVLAGYTYWVLVNDEDGIIIAKQRGTVLTTLMYIVGLGMDIRHQVRVKYRVMNGADDVIYLTDGFTTIKSINLSRLEDYLLAGETIITANADGLGWDLTLFNLFLNFDRPSLDTITVNSGGGSIKMGTYSVVAQYLTETFDAAEWMDTSDIIPIVDESTPYNEIDGGFNSDIPFTTKSITLSYSNIDTSFAFLRLALISNIDGVISSEIIANVPIGSSTLTYTITGGESGEVIPLEDIVVSNQVYETAEDFEIYDNKLWLINVSETTVDHAILQTAVNNITARWICKDTYEEAINSGDTKSSSYYTEHRSHMRDEVYRYVIEFYFNNGFVTSPYLLVGRAKDTGAFTVLPTSGEPNADVNRPPAIDGWDSSLYTITNTYPAGVGEVYLGDVEHLGYTIANIGEQIERWRFCNTGVAIGIGGYPDEIAEGILDQGEFAYWESTELYPEVFGTLAGTPIRDFKFPDTVLTSPADSDSITPIGVKFENIVIPAEYADVIIGYKILRVQRDYSNSSVIDKGLVTRVSKNTYDDSSSDYLQQTAPFNWIDSVGVGAPGDDEYHTKYVNELFQAFHGHRTKLGEYLNADYIKTESVASGTIKTYPGVFTNTYSMDISLGGNLSTEGPINRKINAQALVQADTLTTNSLSVDIDNTEQQEAYFLELNNRLDLSHTTEVLNEGQVIHFYYASLKKNLPAQYGPAEGGIYIPCSRNISSATSTIIFGGDVFISPLYFRRCSKVDDDSFDPANDASDDVTGSIEEYKTLLKVYSESVINMNFRNEGDTEEEVYYPKSFSGNIEDFIWQEQDYDLDLIPNYYDYNKAYSQENNYKPSFGFSEGFDYEDEGEGKFHFRIAVSNQVNQESRNDQFRIFLPNNYRDLPNTKGIGLSLFTKDDKLFASMAHTTYAIPVKAQEIKALDAATYIGTGEVLSLPEQELISTDYDYAGLSSKWAQVVTPYGVVWPNNSGKIFLLSNTLTPISSNGLQQYYQENIKFFIQDKFNEWAETLGSINVYYEGFRNNANQSGLGWHSIYDPQNHRVLFTKRDVYPLFSTGIGAGLYAGVKNSGIIYPEGQYVFDEATQEFQEIIDAGTQETQVLSFNDATLFENKSFTISYSFITNSWTSWHSYIPLIYSSDLETFYSSTSNLRKHNTNNIGEFSGTLYPHIIDFVIKGEGGINVFDELFYISKALIYNTDAKIWHDVLGKTFSKLITYNTTQCSGESEIVDTNTGDNPYLTLTADNNTVIAERLNNLWRLSGFRDISTSSLFKTKAWTLIQDEYFIDAVLQNIDYDKSPYELKAMKDHWLGVRLIFNQEDVRNDKDAIPHKLITDVVGSSSYTKIR